MYSCCSWNTISQLRSVTCHMGSHSDVTCYLTQVNTPRRHPSQTGRNSIYLGLPQRDGRLSWPRWFTRPQTITHPCTNRAQCRLAIRWSDSTRWPLHYAVVFISQRVTGWRIISRSAHLCCTRVTAWTNIASNNTHCTVDQLISVWQ